MPNFDGTGPDGNGPKKQDKGFPQRYRNGQGQGQCRRQGGSGGRQGRNQPQRQNRRRNSN